MRRSDAALAAAALLALAPCPAAGQGAQRGFELERLGRTEQAAASYLLTLRADAANAAALLGLERTLPTLGRLAELPALVAQGLAAAPGSDVVRGLRVRTHVLLGFIDSAAAFTQAWAAAAPGDEHPYRELALVLADAGRFNDARRVLLEGRVALGRGDALAVELADLAERTGAWEEAAVAWAAALNGAPLHLAVAADRLREAPEARRVGVVAALVRPGAAPAVRRLAAELLLAWGEADRAWALFEPTLDDRAPDVVPALRGFADRAGAARTPAGRRVRGFALARLAELMPPPLAARARADAARALIDAGEAAAAQRLLEAVAQDRTAPASARALAAAQVVRSLIAAGQLEAATERLAGDAGLAPGDRATLRLDLARAQLAQGTLDAADAVLGPDSSVDATALRGWVALYRGDLERARELLRDAGPYTGRPGDATDRARMLALLQRVGRSQAPDLGAALLQLERGDSAGAAGALERVARDLPPDGGRAEVLLLAGEIAARLGGPHDAVATWMLEAVIGLGGTGAAPAAAELELARLLLRNGRPEDAIRRLEHLILTYPRSALVPQARRELDRARGAIPRS